MCNLAHTEAENAIVAQRVLPAGRYVHTLHYDDARLVCCYYNFNNGMDGDVISVCDPDTLIERHSLPGKLCGYFGKLPICPYLTLCYSLARSAETSTRSHIRSALE